MKTVSCARMSLLAGVVVSLLLCSQTTEADFMLNEPEPVPGLNTTSADLAPSITADGLELYFTSNRDHGADLSYGDIWVATRATIDEPWGPPRNLGAPVNTSRAEANPCISADGLELYFSEVWPGFVPGSGFRPGGHGLGDIWVSKRDSRESPWGVPVNLGPMINSFEYDGTPYLSMDGLSLYFCTARSPGNGLDLYVSTRPTKDDPWEQAIDVGASINTMAKQDYLMYPFLSIDGLSLFFTAQPWPSTGMAYSDIYVSRRPTENDPWGVPSPFDALNSDRRDEGLTFAPGDSVVYFVRSDPYNPFAMPDTALASFDLWQAESTPIADINSDGVVDAIDFSLVIYSWHTSDSLCDIAPPPMGDGFVDIQDLTVLAEHLGPGFECVAHWRLDEAEGAIAFDSVGDADAVIMGNAEWCPTEGKSGGALQLDGIDDYVSTDFVADPASGLVRVVCWIKSDVAGGAIVSQTPGTGYGSTWLGVDPSDGTLMTEMMFPFPALHSEVVVADGQWHELAIVWDGTYRHLWADKQKVSRDLVPMSIFPIPWDGTFNFGTGENLEPGSFFSGLIDDVRIYGPGANP